MRSLFVIRWIVLRRKGACTLEAITGKGGGRRKVMERVIIRHLFGKSFLDPAHSFRTNNVFKEQWSSSSLCPDFNSENISSRGRNERPLLLCWEEGRR